MAKQTTKEAGVKPHVVLFNEAINKQNPGFGLTHCTNEEMEFAKTQNPNYDNEWQLVDSFETEIEARKCIIEKRDEHIEEFNKAEKKRIAAQNKNK